MKIIRNIIWFFPIGFFSTLFFLMGGIVWSVIIVGIPFGSRYFKVLRVAICPFEYDVWTNFGSNVLGNMLWLIFGGFRMAATFWIIGVFLHITIIGIPLGKQCFKLSSFLFAPFGAVVERTKFLVKEEIWYDRLFSRNTKG